MFLFGAALLIRIEYVLGTYVKHSGGSLGLYISDGTTCGSGLPLPQLAPDDREVSVTPLTLAESCVSRDGDKPASGCRDPDVEGRTGGP